MTNFNPEIFRTYDIRGIYPDEINEDLAYKVARAHIRFLKAKKIALGWDMRIGSDKLAKAAIKGVLDEGADVYNLGQIGIELVYFTCGKYKMDGGIVITASHNPKEYCGMKFIKKNAISLTQVTGLDKIKTIVLEEPWKKEKAKPVGKVIKKNVWPEYVSFMKRIVNPQKLRPLKIVLDAENGMAGLIAKKILDGSKIDYLALNFKPDGNFPKHDPNPVLPENRKELIQKVKGIKAEAGFCFDGDGDRVIVVDENGENLTTDFVGALIVKKLIAENKGGTFVWDVRRGWAVKDICQEEQAKFFQAKAGYPFIKQKMRQKNALFGGETSGHYFYQNFFNADSSILTTLYILEILSKTKMKLSSLVKKLRENYFMIEETNYETKNASKVFSAIEKYYQGKDLKIFHLDGISIESDAWQCNLRVSNTEPLIRLNLETRSKALLKEKTKEIEEIINKNL